MSRFMALLLCGWVVALPYGSVKAEIIIDNAASQPDVNAITMPIVEIRPIAAIDPTVIGFLGDFRFSRDLILQSAMRFPMIAEKLDSESKEHISFEDIQATVEASDYKDLYLFQENPIMRERYKEILVMSDLATVTPFKVWDATVIMNMLATGVIDTENVYYLSPSGEPGEFVGFNPLYTSSIINVYGTLPLITRQPVAEIPEQLRSLQKDVKQYNAMDNRC